MQSFQGRPIKVNKIPRPPDHGILWGWGCNYEGQLGLGNGCSIDRYEAKRLVFIPDGPVRAVSAVSLLPNQDVSTVPSR